jgi:hypothetical protein
VEIQGRKGGEALPEFQLGMTLAEMEQAAIQLCLIKAVRKEPCQVNKR